MIKGENISSLWQEVVDKIKTESNYRNLIPWTSRLVPEHINGSDITFRFVLSGLESLFTDNLKSDLAAVISSINSSISSVGFSTELDFDGITPTAEKNFDNFYTNSENRLAIAAGRAICKKEQNISYNPLYIHAKTGLGKTHILNSIAYTFKEINPEKSMRYLSCEMFVNQFFIASKENKLDYWRNLNLNTDIFIIDNIHNLINHQNALNEFYQLFDQLHLNKKQIVISSSVPAKQLNGFSEQLISRMQWGLEIAINNPEMTTKEQIIENKLKSHNIEIDKPLITNIALSHKGSIRELEGSLNTVCSYSTLLDKKIDSNLVNSVINTTNIQSTTVVMLDDVMEVIADHFKVRKESLLSKSRIRSVAFPRQIGMYLAKDITGNSLEEIGRFFGGRDHSTVKHGCEKIKDKARNDASFKMMLEQLKNKITNLTAV